MGQFFEFILKHDDQSLKIADINFFYCDFIAVPVIEIDNNIIKIGYLINRDFIPSPVNIFKIKINSISFVDEKKNKLIIKLEVYNKAIEFERRIIGYGYSGVLYDFTKIIYYLNKFAETDNFLESLNTSALYDLKLFDYPNILNEINSLKISFSHHHIIRVGKDDMVWDEAIVKNLPLNNYRIRLFAKILGTIRVVEDETFINFEIVGCSSINEINNIKDKLKYNIKELYNYDEDIYCRLTNSNIS